MSNISRRDFIKGVVAGAASVAGYGVLTACGTETPAPAAEAPAVAAAAKLFTPGTYTSVQSTPYAKVEVVCTYTESALSEVSYNVIETSDSDYFTPFADKMKDYCERITAAGSAEGVDGVSGASLCTKAIKDGVSACTVQALGITVQEAAVSVLNPQESGFDTFDGDCAQVFSSIKLGSMELPNRVIKSAGSGIWADADGDKINTGIEVYGKMAANGVSLILLPSAPCGDYGVLPDGLKVKKEGMSLEDAHAHVKELVDAVHANGGKLGLQMCYGGGAPTYVEANVNGASIEDLDAFIDRVGVSAERIKSLGFDCVEIKGASDDNLNAFLVRRVNKREDEYGPQSIENRTRLFVRMIQKIKEVNGEDFPVGALINGVEENDAQLGDNELFLTAEESKAIAKTLEAAGADWIQVRVGAHGQEMNIWAPDVQHAVADANGMTGYGTMFDYSSHFGGLVDGSHSGFGSFLPVVKSIKEAVSIPVGCAAYTDLRVGPDYLDNAISAGELDLVFMNRPLNCDPEMVNKMKEGRREDVRPCMKCMHCHDSVGSNKKYPSSCRMNACSYNALTKTMPEGLELPPIEQAKNVLVIGAGPAGMEAALVAAKRGHKVTLCDADSKLGGRMHFARGVKGDHERFDDVFVYYEAQLAKAGVEVKLNTEVNLAAVKEAAPDAVIVAVGAVLDAKVGKSAGVPIFTPEEAFGNTDALGNRVAIVGSNVQAVDFAAYLTAHGKKVTIINDMDNTELDRGKSGWFKTYIMAYLQANGTKVWHNAQVKSAESDGLTIVSDCGFDTLVKCDSIIELNFAANTALAEEIEAAGFETYSIGDCAAPFNIGRAIKSGNLTARAI